MKWNMSLVHNPRRISGGVPMCCAGSVGWEVYRDYCRYIGSATCSFILAALLLGQAAYIGSEYWLATWAYRSGPFSILLYTLIPGSLAD